MYGRRAGTRLTVSSTAKLKGAPENVVIEISNMLNKPKLMQKIQDKQI